MKSRAEFEYINICDLCGNRTTKLLLKAKDRNYQTGSFNYVQCLKCKLVWLNPRPSQRILSRYYPLKYRAYQKVTKPRTLQKIVRSIINKNKIVAHFLIKDELYFVKHKGKILDVGAGNCEYMEILESWGWDAYGVELNKKTVNQAKKRGVKKLKQGTLFSAGYPGNYFDVVRFSHVLEHVPSPKKELKETKRILSSGGNVLIYIPNLNSLFFKMFKSYWYPLDPPRHFYQFTPQTITKLLLKQGFKNVKISYSQSPYTFIRSLQYLVGAKNVENRYGLLTYPLSLALRSLDIMNKSDVILVTAIKP